jgi:hypothetical protein
MLSRVVGTGDNAVYPAELKTAKFPAHFKLPHAQSSTLAAILPSQALADSTPGSAAPSAAPSTMSQVQAQQVQTALKQLQQTHQQQPQHHQHHQQHLSHAIQFQHQQLQSQQQQRLSELHSYFQSHGGPAPAPAAVQQPQPRSSPARHPVSGYTKSNGTVVKPHWRGDT